MSPQSQYVIGLYRDVNPTKNRCRYDIGCPLGKGFLQFGLESLNWNQDALKIISNFSFIPDPVKGVHLVCIHEKECICES